jgi:hypothetical protein
VFGVVREAARDPRLLEEAVTEANRMATEQVDPLRTRVEGLRVELAEGELAGKETDQLDLEMVAEAIRGFDRAFDHLTAAERREFLQLLIHRITVHKDRVDIDLYGGRKARRFYQTKKRKKNTVSPGVEAGEGVNRTDEEFVNGKGWLPSVDHRQNRGGRGGGAEGDPT